MPYYYLSSRMAAEYAYRNSYSHIYVEFPISSRSNRFRQSPPMAVGNPQG